MVTKKHWDVIYVPVSAWPRLLPVKTAANSRFSITEVTQLLTNILYCLLDDHADSCVCSELMYCHVSLNYTHIAEGGEATSWSPSPSSAHTRTQTCTDTGIRLLVRSHWLQYADYSSSQLQSSYQTNTHTHAHSFCAVSELQNSY